MTVPDRLTLAEYRRLPPGPPSGEGRIIVRCRQLGLPMPTREHRFSERRSRLDLAWVQFKVAIEVHGGMWKRGKDVQIGGRHNRAQGFQRDRRKMAAAQLRGWIVLEFTTEEVAADAWVDELRQALELRKEAP